MRYVIAAIGAAMTLLAGGSASAQVTDRDLAVIGRALNFIEGSEPGERTVALIYDDASLAEAEAVNTLMDGGYSARTITLMPQLVPLSEAAGTISGVDAAILLGGASGGDTALTEAVAGNGVLIVSTDLGCVQSGNCVLSVQTAPSVRMIVNEATASSSAVTFTSAFLMLVERI